MTKLTLLLKVLEGETSETLDAQLSFLHERALPDLGRQHQVRQLADRPRLLRRPAARPRRPRRGGALPHQRLRLGRRSSREILGKAVPEERRGFDAVIGNPPYIRIQTMKEWAPREVEFYKRRYISASKGNYDIYVVFVEHGLSLLSQGGCLGFILPHKFMTASYGAPLRGALSERARLSGIVHFADGQVFSGATTYTCVLLLSGSPQQQFQITHVSDLSKWRQDPQAALASSLPEADATASEWRFVAGQGRPLFERLGRFSRLGELAHLFVGLQTSADPVFVFTKVEERGDGVSRAFSNAAGEWVDLESHLLKPVIRSGNIGRYAAAITARVLFPYNLTPEAAQLIGHEQMASVYPLAWSYLGRFQRNLSQRERGRFAGDGWYQLYPKNLKEWEESKIMVPYMVRRLAAYVDENRSYFVNVTTGGFGIRPTDARVSLAYFAGLLNSRLLDWVSEAGLNELQRRLLRSEQAIPCRAADSLHRASCHAGSRRASSRLATLAARLSTARQATSRTKRSGNSAESIVTSTASSTTSTASPTTRSPSLRGASRPPEANL